MDSSILFQAEETVQTTSIDRNPSTQNVNSSALPSPKTFSIDEGSLNFKPVSDCNYDKKNITALRNSNSIICAINSTSSLNDLDLEEEKVSSLSKIVYERRRRKFGPLPDLRFEQSYLSSIDGAETTWSIAAITIRDQIMLPLLQGTIWSLALLGWAHWNKMAQVSGTSLGSRLRYWWCKNIKLKLLKGKRDTGGNAELAASVGDVSARWSGGENWSFAD